MQIRSLLIDSDKLLKKQLLDLNLLKAKDDEVKPEFKQDPQDLIAEEKNEQDDVKCEIVSSGDERDDFEDNFIAPLQAPPYQQKHSSSKQEVCHICGKEYSRSYIATHLRTHQGEEKSKIFSCKKKNIQNIQKK
jgi:hypothetical protein